MSLIQKQPQNSDRIQLYTLGLNKTLLIVGLGNPGKEYDGTRHNIGFAALDAFAAANDFPAWMPKKDMKCAVAQATLGGSRIILIKPTTFMNLGGEAVSAVANFYKVLTGQTLVVHDELDIVFGQIRTRAGGSSAGHNGVQSVIDYIGENFGRLRIGIGPKTPEQIDSADFVLQQFSKDQTGEIPALLRETSAILSEFIFAAGTLPSETRSFIV